MINYTLQNQLKICDFEHPFGVELDPNNRWVKLADNLPWDKMACIYTKKLSKNTGRKSIDVRLAIAALIIKHKLVISDEEVIESLKENIYLQYFVGFNSFKVKQAFDSSLFVKLRERMGKGEFDEMNKLIIQKSEPTSSQKIKEDNDVHPDREIKDQAKKGKLKLDASVCDQMIDYPTDLKLLNTARKESESIIDFLYDEHRKERESLIEKMYGKTGDKLKVKPRTYRREAKTSYLRLSKKRRKNQKEIRKEQGRQLRYIKRNIGHIENLLDLIEDALSYFPLNYKRQKNYWIIQAIYKQQYEMYTTRKKRVEDRIVNFFQPYVRPISRGKDKARVEFGAKVNVSLSDGFCRLDQLSWDNFNESTKLKEQVENYNDCHGYYPEAVLADAIYGTRENREWLKKKGIRYCGKALGRPKKVEESAYQKRKRKKELAERNHIEGKFGQGKNAYGLTRNRARRQDTSESWVSCIFFVMNLVKFIKNFFFSLFQRFVCLKKQLKTVYFTKKYNIFEKRCRI